MTPHTARFVVALVVTRGRTSRHRPRRRRPGLGTALLLEPSSSSYGWPVEPFHRQHPVRGFFGDPRIAEDGKGTTHSFHFGIDISCPDGTPVYATMSGRVVLDRRHHETISIVGADGDLTFSYWHVVPSVHDGQVAVAYRTVLGHVAKGWAHVHFSESRNGTYVNPLRAGRARAVCRHDPATAEELPRRASSPAALDHAVLGHLRSRRRGLRHDADADRGTVARQARHPGRAAVAAEGIACLADGGRRAVDDPGREPLRPAVRGLDAPEQPVGMPRPVPLLPRPRSRREAFGHIAPSKSGRSTPAATRRRGSSRCRAVDAERLADVQAALRVVRTRCVASRRSRASGSSSSSPPQMLQSARRTSPFFSRVTIPRPSGVNAAAVTADSALSGAPRTCRWLRTRDPTVLGPAVTIQRESGLKCASVTVPLWMRSSGEACRSPRRRRSNRDRGSPVTSREPSGLKATESTSSWCCRSTCCPEGR